MGALERGKREGPSREKSLKLLEGQGRGYREERGEGSGHCCPLIPLPTVQGAGMGWVCWGSGLIGRREGQEKCIVKT